MTGTVTGMITSFTGMSEMGGLEGHMVAAGVSEALVNTAFGLFAAICGIVAYNFFVNKVDQFNYNVDEAAYLMLETLKEKEGQ